MLVICIFLFGPIDNVVVNMTVLILSLSMLGPTLVETFVYICVLRSKFTRKDLSQDMSKMVSEISPTSPPPICATEHDRLMFKLHGKITFLWKN